jgi:hypothetical protein
MRWLWEGPPLVNGLILGLAWMVLAFGFGVWIHPYLFVAAILAIVALYFAAVFSAQAVRFALMSPDVRRLRLRILQTNYGREAGWYVERDGKQLAQLTNPRWEDMFWYSYALVPLTEDIVERERIVSDETWWHVPGLVFRSREFELIAPLAFVGMSVFTETGRVMMRRLNLPIGSPNMWERLWLRLFARG